jgi:hypothetical protein
VTSRSQGAVAALALLLAAGAALADEPAPHSAPLSPAEYVRAASAGLRAIAGRHTTLDPLSSDARFCEAVRSDLIENRDVRVVEPVAGAERWDDPAFDFLRAACPETDLLKIITDPSYDDMPDEMQDEHGVAVYVSRNFLLYKVDIDNDPRTGEDGRDLVLYGEDVCTRLYPDRCITPEYLHIDLESCARGVVGSGARPARDVGHIVGHTAIVDYHGRRYVVSGSEDPKQPAKVGLLSLTEYSSRGPTFRGEHFCIFN